MLACVLTVRVDEDVDIRQLHELPVPRESLDIVVFQQRRCLIDIVTRETAAGSERHQFEAIPFRGRGRPQAQPDRLLDEAADRGARLGGTLL